MYQPDYIMRTIKQFSEMLAALLFGARAKEQITFNDLEELSLSFTGLSLETLIALGPQQLRNLYSATGTLDIDKVYISARLLYQLSEQEGEARRALALKEKALKLLLEVHRVFGDFLNDEHEVLVSELQAALAQQPSSLQN